MIRFLNSGELLACWQRSSSDNTCRCLQEKGQKGNLGTHGPPFKEGILYQWFSTFRLFITWLGHYPDNFYFFFHQVCKLLLGKLFTKLIGYLQRIKDDNVFQLLCVLTCCIGGFLCQLIRLKMQRNKYCIYGNVFNNAQYLFYKTDKLRMSRGTCI